MEGNGGGWQRWVGVVGYTLIAVGFLGFSIHLWQKISSGHGLDTYFTGFGVQFNYLGAGILFALVPVVLIAGALLNWWLGREERDFKRRYGVDDEGP
jgi:hypothetical protein